MKPDWSPAGDWEVIESRARMLHATRAFFHARGVVEVETPLLSRCAATDPHLHSFSTCFRSERLYLNTSPEFAMKRMLAAWGRPMYQICKAFRDGESGPLHNPEFTLLEWYRPGYDMSALMDEVEQLFLGFSDRLFPSARIRAGFQRLSYAALFDEIGLDVHAADADTCRACAGQQGIDIPAGMGADVDEWRDWLLVRCVLPRMPRDRFTFIYDYPASQSSLARLRRDEEGREVAARFELLFGDIELANGFEELTDPVEQQHRFEQENRKREQRGLPVMPVDHRLLASLESGLPQCSGVAMGLDRVLMLLSESTAIDEVIAFPVSNA